MPKKLEKQITLVVAALLVLGCCFAQAASATVVNFTWDSAGASLSNKWSEADNWVGDVAPEPSSSIGTLTFPGGAENSLSSNDVSGLTINHLQIEDAAFSGIRGEGFALGSGGLSDTIFPGSSPFLISSPITLTSNQTWTLNESGSEGEIQVLGPLLGENANLTFDLENETGLSLGNLTPIDPGTPNDEVGTITINGSEKVAGELRSISTVILEDGSFNNTDGHPIMVHNISLETGEATGPITATNSILLLTGSSVGALNASNSILAPGGDVTLPGVTLDEGSTLLLDVGDDGSTADELLSTGPIDLGGAKLEVSGFASSEHEDDECKPPAGQTSTLVSAAGKLSGSFSNAPNGLVVTASCKNYDSKNEVTSEPTYSYRIGYNTSVSPETVTATIVGEEPVNQAPGTPPPNDGGIAPVTTPISAPVVKPPVSTHSVPVKPNKKSPKCKTEKVKRGKKTKTERVCAKPKPKKKPKKK